VTEEKEEKGINGGKGEKEIGEKDRNRDRSKGKEKGILCTGDPYYVLYTALLMF
jgi:hypothetical protein